MSCPVATLGEGRIEVRCKYDFRSFLLSIGAEWDPVGKCWFLPLTLDGLQTARRVAGILIDARLPQLLDEPAEIAPDAPVEDVTLPVRATPYAHQKAGYARALDALRGGGGYALLFEQGCGKTLTAIAALGALLPDNGGALKVLIVAPLSVVPVWPAEFQRFAAYPTRCEPLLQKPIDKRVAVLRAEMKKPLPEGVSAWVTNYDAVRSPAFLKALLDMRFDAVICDESQRIKAPTAQTSKAVHKLGAAAKYRMILTGTPVGNSPLDIWSQYKFLLPNVFQPSFYAFRARYATIGGFSGHQILGYNNLQELTDKLAKTSSRVRKCDALDLPEYVDQKYTCELDKPARKAYDTLRDEAILELDGEVKLTAPMVVTKLMRLAQFTGGFVGNDCCAVQSAKLDLFRDVAQDLLDAGHKIVVFAQFLPEIYALRDICGEMIGPDGVVTIYGDVPGDERGEIVERFQTNPEARAFVAQIRTAGLGLTLTAADVTIFYSTGYSLIDYQQARDRIHRVGQDKACTCIHLVVKGTVDEAIMDALSAKRDMASGMIDNWRDVIAR